jgi:hypothetical protein
VAKSFYSVVALVTVECTNNVKPEISRIEKMLERAINFAGEYFSNKFKATKCLP